MNYVVDQPGAGHVGVVLAVLLAHFAATWAMVGLVWFVQFVHYPLFARVGLDGFVAYQRSHTSRTSTLTAVVMSVEAATAIALAWMLRDTTSGTLASAGLVLVGVLWLSTFGVQIPLHARLLHGFDQRVLVRLIATNWVRTAAWSTRGVIAAMLIWNLARGPAAASGLE